jgi:hypothetical protein
LRQCRAETPGKQARYYTLLLDELTRQGSHKGCIEVLLCWLDLGFLVNHVRGAIHMRLAVLIGFVSGLGQYYGTSDEHEAMARLYLTPNECKMYRDRFFTVHNH